MELVRDIKAGEETGILTAAYDFSVISFWKPSQPDSVVFEDYFELAKILFDQKTRDKEWQSRKIGWFRIDIEALPEYAHSVNNQPDQIVMSKETGMYRFLGLSKTEDKEQEQVKNIANTVRELTGDWVTQIDCNNIQFWNRPLNDEAVYFGAEEDLNQDGKAATFSEAAMIDKYTFNEGRYNFYYNSDPECRLQRGLEKDQEYIVFFNGEKTLPAVLEVGKDDIETATLIYESTLHALHGTPKWNHRS